MVHTFSLDRDETILCLYCEGRGGGREGRREGGREGDPTVSGTHVQFGHTCDNILSLL